MIQLHNKARAEKHLVKLTWNAGIAAKAAQLAKTGKVLVHEVPKGCGQNLAAGSGWPATTSVLSGLFNLWMKEKSKYHCQAISNSNYHVFGHYTQVMWSSTRSVGCGAAKRFGSTYLVCNYKPPGNYLHEKPYKC